MQWVAFSRLACFRKIQSFRWRIFLTRFAFAGILLCPGVELPGQIETQGDAALSLHYSLQATSLNAERQQELADFLLEHGNAGFYFLVHGYACDTGGYHPSYRIADVRARNLRDALLAQNVRADHVLAVEGIVLVGEPRRDHRRSELVVFQDRRRFEEAARQSRRAADRLNRRARQVLLGGGDANGIGADGGNTNAEAANASPSESPFPWLLIIGILFVLILPAAFIWLYRKRDRMGTHRLLPSEAEELAGITGSALPIGIRSEGRTADVTAAQANTEPMNVKERAPHKSGGSGRKIRMTHARAEQARESRRSDYHNPAKIYDFVDRARRGTMAKKKKSRFSIRGALDKPYESRSLNELRECPVDALEGLTARHARLLEEAFGIKTIEDLAYLKYVEIAKAIVVLSEYEK